jgi:hypothetical protein
MPDAVSRDEGNPLAAQRTDYDIRAWFSERRIHRLSAYVRQFGH